MALTEPAFNIIDLVWDYIKKKKQLRQPMSTEEMWPDLQDAWNNLLYLAAHQTYTDVEEIKSLI